MKVLYITFLIFLLPINIFAQWFPQNSGTTNDFNHVYFVTPTTGWATINSIIFKTTDGGNNWFQQTDLTPEYIESIFFQDENNGWYLSYSFSGVESRIYKTTNGGNTFQQTYYLPESHLYEIKFVNNKLGWCVGGGGTYPLPWVPVVLKTTDGGNTWLHTLVSPSYWDVFISVDFLNDLQGWIGGASVIFKTSDGGNNWTEITFPTFSLIEEIQFIDWNVGWVRANDNYNYGILYKTTDNGLSWVLQANQIKSFYFINSTNGWYIFNNNIFHTTDGGDNWEIQNSNTANNLYDIYFVDLSNGWAVGENGTILYTPNGGLPVELLNFTAELTDNNILLSWITATETNNQGFEIERKLYSEDWEKIGFVEGKGTTTEPQFYSFTDHNVTPGKYEYRLKQIDFDGTFEYSDIVQVEVGFPTEFSLLQNYPNPFNPSTSIQYAISSPQFVTIKVYDLLGKEIATLVNEEKPAGEYKVEFSAANLPSGIYFYRIQAGDFINTKKMVLLR